MDCPRCKSTGKVRELARTSYEFVWVNCPRCGGKGVVTLYYVECDGFGLKFIQNVLGNRRTSLARDEDASHFNSPNEATAMAERYGLKEGTFEVKTV